MKKVILLLCIGFVFWSCSNDDDTSSTHENFFNLNEGNLWVYKRYYSNDDVTYNFRNVTDSVRVEGDTIINGDTYSKVVHKQFNSNGLSGINEEYLKVNNSGHLVNENGTVFHPGTDAQYQRTREISFSDGNGSSIIYGYINYQLAPAPINVSVEGSNYLVYSYNGTFVSTQPEVPSSNIFYQYKEGVGFVVLHDVGVSGGHYEDRLVYYDLN